MRTDAVAGIVIRIRNTKKLKRSIVKQFCIILFSFTICCVSAAQWSSRFVQLNKDGTLSYIPDEKGNIIPDFSNVGYHHGKPNIPDVAVMRTITASDTNSQAIIQSAIDEVSAMPVNNDGFRGAILLKKGIYKIAGTIRITASGIVLRGEGSETVLIATGKGQRTLLQVSGTGSIKEVKRSRVHLTEKYVPVGAKSFTVSSTEGFMVGDRIILFRPGTKKWIEDLKMHQIVVRDTGTRQWQPHEYSFKFERVITKISGDRIFIDNPVVIPLEEKYGGAEVYKYTFDGRLHEVGIENLLCVSEYTSGKDEDHGWNAIMFNRIENGWVKNVTAMHFGYSCVNLGSDAKNITVDSCRYLQPKSQVTGGRRYSFNNDGQQNLVMNCFASEGRHDYVTGARVCGPNVFYNCKSQDAKADIGPHQRWAMGTLYDNIITDGEINVQDRGNWGTGHGWSGVTQVLWNCTASGAAVQNPWIGGNNYVIGFKGKKLSGRLKDRPEAEWEGLNTEGLLPASLYLIQLAQ
jgi:hypothetical protein